MHDALDGRELGEVLERLPNAKGVDEEAVGEAVSEHLRNDEDVGRERADRHTGIVEEPDRVGAALAAEAVGPDADPDAEILQVDDDREDHNGRDAVHDVQEAIAPERLAKGAALVFPK